MTPKKKYYSLDEKFKLVADTIRAYPLQLKQSWEEVSSMYIPDEYKNIDSVVLCGMGGSALNGRIAKSLLFDRLRVPFEVSTDFKIPNYVNAKTLVIASSYSGSTEETINSTLEALQRGAKVFGVTTGGKLGDLCIENKLPCYIFDPKHNPSKQPRMSQAYMSGSILALFNMLGLATILEEEIENSIISMNELLTDVHENVSSERNLAKSYSEKLRGKIPVLVSSEHLLGISHAIKNQFNENAKTFCLLFDIPELNHHLMEGLKYPQKNRELLKFVFLNSELYSEKVKRRYPLTAEVVEKNGIDYLMYSPRTSNKISQVYEVLIFGSFLVYHLTKSYSIDPLEIPWVDYFKAKLSEKSNK